MQALLDAIAAMSLPVDACRIFHGRGGLYSGCEQWTLDAYPPVFVLTSFAPMTDEQLATIGAALQARWSHLAPPGQQDALAWVFQQRGQAAQGPAGPGARVDTRLMAGNVPDPHIVTEGPALFLVHMLRGQNHGLFLDMAEGRRWVRDHVLAYKAQQSVQDRGLAVLNLFAYTCAFSVVALQAGARLVVNVDMGQGAMATGQQNHQRNGITTGASFLVHDIFKTWGKINRSGPYGLVIVDPPSYQKGSFIATKDYARLMRRLPELLAPGGHVLLCLNAPELGVDFLHRQMQELAPELALVERLANPPAFADVSPDRALKVLIYRARL